MKRLLLSMLTVVLASGGCPLLVYGDAADSPKGSNEPIELNEIVVTAQKRAATVQDTPISMTVLTGGVLDEVGAGTTSTLGIAQLVPGISTRSSGPGQTEFEMRGLSSAGGSAPTVGFYLDEAPLTGTAGTLIGKVVIDPSLFDLNRIEVLRGPQGTLYGAGSMGGTIRMITNAPDTKEWDSTVEGTAARIGDSTNWQTNAMLNMPLIQDTLALRLVATDSYTAGWISRIVVNPFPVGQGGSCGYAICTRGNVLAAPVEAIYPNSNWERNQNFRGSLLFTPTDTTAIRFTALYENIDTGGYSQVDSPPGTLAHYQPFNIPEPYVDRFTLFSLDLTQKIGPTQLVVTGTYWSRNSNNLADISEAQQNLFSTFFGFNTFLPATYQEIDKTIQRSVEARLSSDTDSPLHWLIGGFASNMESINDTTTGNPVLAPLSTGGAAANPEGIVFDTYDPYQVKQYALFTEETYKFGNGLEATAGVRWFKYDTTFSWGQTGIFTASGNATPTTGSNEASNTGFSPKFNLAYIPNGNLTTYATISKGFRPGGANQPLPPAQCGPGHPSTYDPDTIWNYELGEKARLWNGRVSINSDVYYIDWKNIQQYLIVEPCGFAYTTNAGNAKAYGPELEITARVTPEITVSMNGVYTKSEITKVSPQAQGFIIAQGQPISPGTAIQNVPLYTATATVDYRRPITDSIDLISRAFDSYVGPSHDVAYYYQELPGYNLVNLRVGISKGHFEGFLFGDNLADKHAPLTINTTSFAVQVPDITRISTNQPRTIGVDFKYRFKP